MLMDFRDGQFSKAKLPMFFTPFSITTFFISSLESTKEQDYNHLVCQEILAHYNSLAYPFLIWAMCHSQTESM